MDDAERLIRDAKPVEQPLSPRAEASLARILATGLTQAASSTVVSRQRHHPRWRWPAAAAALVVLVVGGLNLFGPAPAHAAATPPMLDITPIDTKAQTLLRELQSTAAAQPSRPTEGQMSATWWALSSDVDDAGTIASSFVDPRRRVSIIGPDGITSYTDFAAQPYDAQGNPVADPSAPAVGTELESGTVEPEGRLFPDPPPTNPDAFGVYLAEALEPYSDSPTVNAFSGITSLLTERILNPSQTAAAIGHLTALPDIQLLGSSTDRIGRHVLVFASPIDGDHQILLMLSPDTGAIAASETISRGHQRTDISDPAVVSYTGWDAR